MNISKYQDKKEVKKNAIYLGGFLLLIGFIQMFLANSAYLYFFLAGFFVLIVGFFLPDLIKPVIIGLAYVGFYLGEINGKILLTTFYYFFITPIGFLLKMAGKNPLDLRIQKEAKSYWIKRSDVNFEKIDFENQF